MLGLIYIRITLAKVYYHKLKTMLHQVLLNEVHILAVGD